MKKNGLTWLAGGLAFVWMLNACNVFDQAGSKTKDLDYQGLLLRGNNALDAGNSLQSIARADTAAGNRAKSLGDTAKANASFAAGAAAFKSATPYFKQALDIYDSAMKKYPEGSEAYLFHAQAIVHLYQIDYNRINNEFKQADSGGLPFIHGADTTYDTTFAGVDTLINPASTVPGIDSLYFPVNRAVADLEHILRPAAETLYLTTDHNPLLSLPPDSNMAADGRVSSSVARLDLGILSAVKALLVMIDLDNSGHIDSMCTVTRPGIDTCPTGTLSEVDRLNNFISLTKSLTIDTLDTKNLSEKAKELSNNPTDINGYVKSMQQPLASAAYNLDSVHSSFQSHGQTALSDNIAKTVTRIQDMSNFIGYIQYNNHVDDDNDAQTNVSATPMLWHDYDNDNGVHYDYDDVGGDGYIQYTYGNGTNYGNPGNIGHPFHRYLKRDTLYLTYAAWTAAHPQLAKDTSVNGRIPKMKKRCLTLVDSFDIQIKALPADLKAGLISACNTYSPVLKAGVTPPASGHSDWISGTAGVDEEVLDGFDNDYDGITDEDARNQKGYDDDKDAPLRTCMLKGSTCADGAVLDTMHWKDLSWVDSLGVVHNPNKCIDIDTAHHVYIPNSGPDSARDSARVFCIGTLENRLYLARTGGTTALDFYYQRTNEGATKDCSNDYNNRLDSRFKSWFQATPDELDKACGNKHIWIAPRPPRSEWTGGTFGIDEEICGDGIDNDGDGWVDEDCGSH